jgi:hypothetical protein
MHEDELREEFVRLEERPDGRCDVLIQVIHWPHPHTPSAEWVLWKRLHEPGSGTEREVIARQALKDERFFGTCKECGERNPKGWMHSASLCQGCAQGNHGVVY